MLGIPNEQLLAYLILAEHEVGVICFHQSDMLREACRHNRTVLVEVSCYDKYPPTQNCFFLNVFAYALSILEYDLHCNHSANILDNGNLLS